MAAKWVCVVDAVLGVAGVLEEEGAFVPPFAPFAPFVPVELSVACLLFCVVLCWCYDQVLSAQSIVAHIQHAQLCSKLSLPNT